MSDESLRRRWRDVGSLQDDGDRADDRSHALRTSRRVSLSKTKMFTRLYDKVRETPMWLSTANGDLYAVEYATQGTVSRPPVVIAAPDGEEHAWAARNLVLVARALAYYG